MAETMDDRTEEPTAKRKKEARDDGKIPKTPELSSAIVLLSAGLMVGPGGTQIGALLAEVLRTSFMAGGVSGMNAAVSVDSIRWILAAAAVGLLPFVGVVTGAALAVGVVQGQGTLTAKPLAPDWSRLSPVQNSKRFLSPRPLVDLLKASLKILLVGAVIYVSTAGAIEQFTSLPQSNVPALISMLRTQVALVLLSSGAALLLLAAGDFGYQAWDHQRQLRMTKQEVKQESKDSDGDPLVKARIRSLARSLARMRMMQAVPTADVVVTNPTHIAVALKYDPGQADAPIVVAMGSRKLAKRIRQVAEHAGVPIIEHKPVARALFATARIGLPIPAALYVAVAEILAFVARHHRGASRRARGWT